MSVKTNALRRLTIAPSNTGVKSQTRSLHLNQRRHKKPTPPTIAQHMRNKENRLKEEFHASLKTCPLDMPKNIRFGSEGDDIEEVRLQMMKS